MQKLCGRKELGIQEPVKRPVWQEPGGKGSGGDELAEVPRAHPSQPPAGQARLVLRTGFGFPPAYDGKLGEQGSGE